jgi:hypothetical protein
MLTAYSRIQPVCRIIQIFEKSVFVYQRHILPGRNYGLKSHLALALSICLETALRCGLQSYANVFRILYYSVEIHQFKTIQNA